MEKIINKKTSVVRSSSKNSDIYRRFKNEFDYMLSNPICVDSRLYVTDPYEEQLNAIIHSNANTVNFLVGATGIGKTTLIKHCFNISNASSTIFEDKLVIPTFWDGRHPQSYKNCQQIIANSLASACDRIDHELNLCFPSSDDVEKFYNYIMSTRDDLIIPLDPEKRRKKSPEDIMFAELTAASKANPIGYYSSQIKYFIEEYHNEIHQIFLILDDIETVSQKMQSYMIDVYHHIFACLQNNKTNSYSVNLLISLRPFSYRYLNKGNFWKREAAAYYHRPIVVWKSAPPNLFEIFRKRFNYAVRQSPPPIKQKSWQQSYDAVCAILKKVSGSERIIDMLVKLNLSNIRGIMDSLKIILCNRTWFQRNSGAAEHPHIDPSSYGFDNIITIIRSLACGESHFFNGSDDITYFYTNYNSLDSGDRYFFNLVCDQEKRCDIFCTYLIKYLFDNRVDFYNDESKSIADIKEVFDSVFGSSIKSSYNEYNRMFSYAKELLFNAKIIRKSINAEDSETMLNTLKDNDKVYLSQRGEIFWKMLAWDSMLLELYREDLLRNYQDDKYYMGSIEYRTLDMVQILFDDLLNLVSEIIHSEEKYITLASTVEHGVSKYRDFFGLFQISTMFLDGVKESLRRSKYCCDRHLIDKVNYLEYELDKLRSHYRDVHC